MHLISQQLDRLLDRLDPRSASRLEQAVRGVVTLAGRSSNVPEIIDDMGYPLGYFESTAGCFADEPFERPPELPLETREIW